MKQDSKPGQARAEKQLNSVFRTSGRYSESVRIHEAISDVHRTSSAHEKAGVGLGIRSFLIENRNKGIQAITNSRYLEKFRIA